MRYDAGALPENRRSRVEDDSMTQPEQRTSSTRGAARDTHRPGLSRAAVRRAWTIWACSLALASVWVVLTAIGGRAPVVLAASAGFPLAFATVGALVASRRPANPIGWLLSSMGFTFALALASSAYATRALVARPGSLPGPEYAVWAQDWAFGAALAPVIVVVLLFPNGRPLTPRWRWAVRAWALGIGTAVLGSTLTTRAFSGDRPTTANPFFVPALAGLAGPLMLLAALCIVPALLAAVVSAVLRYRRAAGIERQHLKWLAFASATLVPATGLLAVMDTSWAAERPVVHDLIVAGTAAVPTLIPVAVGIAILRHRLYDIDRLINRTLVYASLTALLGVGYLLGVVLLQRLLDPLTRGSDLAVAGTTLAVAALARPARGRVQALVDQRFNRRRYDAARTLESFCARLRTQLDLDTLGAEVCAVAREAMQPTHVSLWLRDAG
jgi:hypothetical protein